ncbi:kin of IRRE-like protein 3 isoform X2 [Magallana gigas]|uniref:kin of IRRE-like protein 3 isoform X2 n=1 Tax=Magallana gigas TaxID=29159 RepID=UPI003341B3CB
MMCNFNSGCNIFIHFLVCFSFNVWITNGQRYNLTGSSEFAVLGEAFTWTCDMFVPPGYTSNAVKFFRDNKLCVVIANTNAACATQRDNCGYSYKCVSESMFSLTIPAENMTEYENGSKWRCDYVVNVAGNASPQIVLNIAIDVHNVSLIPSDKPLTISEHKLIEVLCEVNRNAFPAPLITWYLDSSIITAIEGSHETSITLVGNRTDNMKTLLCTASNMNKTVNASTTLNVEYPPIVNALSNQNTIEGGDLTVNCTATPGNPSATTFYWTKVDNQGFRQNGAILQLYNTQRTSSGTYRCTAENNYSNKEKGMHSQSMVIDVLYPPTVNALSRQDMIEGGNLSVDCLATPGNPSSTTFYWTKEDDPEFRQKGSIIQLYTIQRNSSGTFRCTAENLYYDEERGIHSQSMVVNVQYPPVVNVLSNQNIIEGGDLTVNCTATPGNPSATTFYWTKVNNPEFRQNGSTLQLYNTQRTSSGTYKCTAENIFMNGERGTDSQSFVASVRYTSDPGVAVVAGSVGGTITVIVIVIITVILVYRRYHSHSEQQKKDKNKIVTTNEDTSNYTTLEGHESRERNEYDKLEKSKATNRYADILSTENKEKNTVTYENLQRPVDAKVTEYYNLQNMDGECVFKISSKEPGGHFYENTFL